MNRELLALLCAMLATDVGCFVPSFSTFSPRTSCFQSCTRARTFYKRDKESRSQLPRRRTFPAMNSAENLKNMNKKGVLFVCLGNICRSPAAEGVFLSAVKVGSDEFFILLLPVTIKSALCDFHFSSARGWKVHSMSTLAAQEAAVRTGSAQEVFSEAAKAPLRTRPHELRACERA